MRSTNMDRNNPGRVDNTSTATSGGLQVAMHSQLSHFLVFLFNSLCNSVTLWVCVYNTCIHLRNKLYRTYVSKKLHHFIFAITLSHTYSLVNLLSQTYFIFFTRKRGNCECIANRSRQPDAAQSLSALISSPVPSFNSLSLSVAVLERFYCLYLTLRCDLELWPRDLDLTFDLEHM